MATRLRRSTSVLTLCRGRAGALLERADSQRIELDPQEEKLRALLRQEGWFAATLPAGLISLPKVGSDPRITASARAAILRHELSHGEFFSNPAYAEYVRGFWTQQLTEDERAGVRASLGREEYKTSAMKS